MFSDAVLAVAITLLALNLMVADRGHGSLARLLFHEWPALTAYVISFFTIGIVWMNHHALLSVVETVDRSLQFFNLILLLFVVLIPDATRLLADDLAADGSDAQLAAAVYGVVLEGMSLGFVLMTEWLLRAGRTESSIPSYRPWASRRRYYLAPLLYLAIIGFAFVYPVSALVISGVVNAYYAFEQTPSRARGLIEPDDVDKQ
jgi:TMEM175 potassium channel family protein